MPQALSRRRPPQGQRKFARKLYELRKRRGMSTQDVADRTKLKLRMVKSFERAKAEPDVDELIKLSTVLEVPVSYLLVGLKPRDFPAPEEAPTKRMLERIEAGEPDDDGRYLPLGKLIRLAGALECEPADLLRGAKWPDEAEHESEPE